MEEEQFLTLQREAGGQDGGESYLDSRHLLQPEIFLRRGGEVLLSAQKPGKISSASRPFLHGNH